MPGASMAAVAERAGVSTKTMYRLIPTKADLFRSVVLRSDLALHAGHRSESARTLSSWRQRLERMLVAYGTLNLDGEAIAIIRLVHRRDATAFPRLAASLLRDSPFRRTSEAMEGWLRRQCDQGLLALDDPGVAADMLRGMMIMEPQRAVMLGQRPAPDAEEIAARASMCARLFLNGCRSIG